MRGTRRRQMRRLTVVGAVLWGFLPFGLPAQTPVHRERFTTSCKTCWPNWIELTRPLYGVGPSTQNGRGLIFINGFDPDPEGNRQHLRWSRPNAEAISQVTASFQFNNAAIGGKLPLLTGGFMCMKETNVHTVVANELLILTLGDQNDTWYGAFLGDLTALDPTFTPEVETPQPQAYATFGLLQKSDSGLELLALQIIPPLPRFTPIALSLTFIPEDAEAQAPVLQAHITLPTSATYRVRSPVDAARLSEDRSIGILYQVSPAPPCTSFLQREVLFREIQVR